MRARLPIFRALTDVDLASDTVRNSPATLEIINRAGLGWKSAAEINKQWERINFLVENTRGRVLEIGCATGLVTKYLSRNPQVDSVLALDISPECIEYLVSMKLPKVTGAVLDLTSSDLNEPQLLFDTVVLGELLEHLDAGGERRMLGHIWPHLIEGQSCFVITTPLGYMPAPDHKRGFGRRVCRLHLSLLYGMIVKEHFIGATYQCYVVKARRRRLLPGLYGMLGGSETLQRAQAFITGKRRADKSQPSSAQFQGNSRGKKIEEVQITDNEEREKNDHEAKRELRVCSVSAHQYGSAYYAQGRPAGPLQQRFLSAGYQRGNECGKHCVVFGVARESAHHLCEGESCREADQGQSGEPAHGLRRQGR